MGELAVRIEPFASPGALPTDARALFGDNAFSTLAWYASVAQAAVPRRAEPCFQLVRRGPVVLGICPMWRDAQGYAAMTTPYTLQWSPLLRPDLDSADIAAVGQALGGVWRRQAATRLEALDSGAVWFGPMMRGLRRAGLVPLQFDHFGNWHQHVAGLCWERYLAARPGALRSAVARRSKRLLQHAAFTLVTGAQGLETGLADYTRVYAASWKAPEPFPQFNPTLMRAAAASGNLLLGLLHMNKAPVAAQFWLRHGGWAGVQKLAHDEAHRALAPGTVLTALMIRHLLDSQGSTELDFGRGDDLYKQQWTAERRQRVGVVFAAPWHVGGAVQIARHWAGRLRARSGSESFVPTGPEG